MSFDSDEDVKEQEGHMPLLLTMDKWCRTTAEILVIAGASIMVHQGSGRNMLQIAASFQNWF